MKKLKIKLSYNSFRILIECIGLYINRFENLEKLILISLKEKLWKKALDEKDIKLSLEPFQASAIKEVLLMLPTEIPTNEQNELRQMLWKLDQELLEC